MKRNLVFKSIECRVISNGYIDSLDSIEDTNLLPRCKSIIVLLGIRVREFSYVKDTFNVIGVGVVEVKVTYDFEKNGNLIKEKQALAESELLYNILSSLK